MDITEIMAAIMVICFGLSWPGSIVKSWRSRTSKGKSLFFLCMIVIGYTVGLWWKVLDYQRTGVFRYPAVFYALNLIMVMTDIGLYFRNRRLDLARGSSK